MNRITSDLLVVDLALLMITLVHSVEEFISMLMAPGHFNVDWRRCQHFDAGDLLWRPAQSPSFCPSLFISFIYFCFKIVFFFNIFIFVDLMLLLLADRYAPIF